MDKSTWEKPKVKTLDSLRRGAGQGATRLLRFVTAPAGDSTPTLRLKTLVWPKGSLSALSGPKTPPLFPS